MNRKRRGPWIAAVAAIALTLLLPMRAAAEGDPAATPDDSALLLFPPVIAGEGSQTAATLGAALVEALGRALADVSFRVRSSGESLPLSGDQPSQASVRALASGAGWAAVVSLEVADRRIAYTLRVYDARESALAAAAGFSAYAGVSSLPLFEDSARKVAAKAEAWRSSAARGGSTVVRYRITVSSPDEGAAVSVAVAGEKAALEVGAIRDGSIELPYIPYEIGTKVVISLVKNGKRRVDIPVVLETEAQTISAPPLRNIEREDLLAGTGPGRLLGLGVTYRRYLRPDWYFLFFNERLFAGYDFAPGSRPVLHLESWTGLGSYLVFPQESPFRMGFCLGGGPLISMVPAGSSDGGASYFLDFAIIPIETFMEYRIRSGPTVWLSIRGAYSVNSAGLLGRGWMGKGQPDLSAGILWRR